MLFTLVEKNNKKKLSYNIEKKTLSLHIMDCGNLLLISGCFTSVEKDI